MMGDSTKEETKIDVEEACVNLNCVKNELPEEVVKLEQNLHVTQYRVTPEIIFGVALCKRNFEECDDNLIGFLENDALMENVVIKLDWIKEEDGNFVYCNKCNGDYNGFCLKCSTLTRILNNASPLISPDSEINTVPNDILEIRDISMERGVFLLKTLPKNIIFGPFEGISALRNAKGNGWKIKNKRLENANNGNWMKDIATNASIKNLDIFQMEGNLYFQTNREIMEGEELLVCYDDEEKRLDDSQKCYFTPREQEDLPQICACTMCCLGFQLVSCLLDHKRKCPHAIRNTDVKDFELVECHCCKIWLERREHQEYHKDYCWEKYLRMSYLQAQPVNRNQVKVEEIEDDLNTEAVHGGFKCSQCSYETNDEMNLQKHLNTHKELFQCNICKMKFTQKGTLKRHIKNTHTENGCTKDYQCPECGYQTNYKQNYQTHLNRHRGIKPFECGICQMKFTDKQGLSNHIKKKHTENVNPFECDICMMKFTYKGTLKTHIKNKHTENGCAKDYQCPECGYQTNYKQNYQTHLNHHRGIKPFECGICKAKYTEKQSLKKHIKNKHSENGCAKNYQCLECNYQTNDKRCYQTHLNGHRGIKPYECGICKMKFTTKGNLNSHVKTKHTENINPFECDICKAKYTEKQSLSKHIKKKHLENGSTKDYQCSECTYQTFYKRDYQHHLNVHRGIKPYECRICKMKYINKSSLERHVKNKHANNGHPFE